ncbi:translational GTPase TypA [Chondromyces apiculatus]|uniref:Large ribosomal subunit assembly factor BipA n=1 Tax=Chondromyces apiculatus DSM 436 TaxID=1192034 RepID=A0A017T2D1_9BACT|nr:translational GTPase TypA [Chondromyces apiculatus]EYF02995.1 GTP-binding protein TypA/BipA [Chondromyces apiculatus DSM 436]
MAQNLRNIAIVAHVDHGKTTLVDHMLRQAGAFRENEEVVERVMDSNDLERERGITILAKNTSVRYKGTKINIVDTPGHADFGGEVERTLMMADGAILLVDAAEGPLPQTRFVLSKCLERKFPVILVVNKIDRSDARPHEVLSEVFDLFCDLEASDTQLDFSTLYAIGKLGQAKKEMTDVATDLTPLFETILSKVPAPAGDPEGPLQIIICNTAHDDYVGKLAVGRVVRGTVKNNQEVLVLGEEGQTRGSVKVLYAFEGLKRGVVQSASAGEVVAVAGLDSATIGDTIVVPTHPEALPRIVVEEPTIKMRIGVNTSPFAGKSKQSKFLTSRHLKDRLEKEAMRNLAIRVEPTESPDTFLVLGRGELQLAILVETMRREGYEVQLSNPEVVTREVNGDIVEPVELVVVDVPESFVGVVTERLSTRRGRMVKMTNPGFGRARLEFKVPSRGLIGFRGEFLTSTRGTGLLNTMFDGWAPWGGPMMRRPTGAIVSDRAGVATPYALHHLQPRGQFFINPGVEVYEGMIVGEHNRNNDTDCNVIKEKKLSNVRNHGKDENVLLAPPKVLNIETAMEWIDGDELVEVTPEAVRVRKRVLACNLRDRREDAIENAQAVT